MEENGRVESLCHVCGDKASGKHYGVPSCDGCRGFFKRSIRRVARNMDYVCKENGQCIVDVSRRNQCQACRFAKCLQVNMKRDAVQHERAPRSSTTAASMAAMAAAAAAAARSKQSVGGGGGGPGSGVFHPSAAHIYAAAAAAGGGGAPGSAGPAPSAAAPYHPLLYPAAAFFSFKPAVPAFAPPVDTSDLLRLTTAAHFMPRVVPTQPPPPPPPSRPPPPAPETLSTSAGKEDEVTSSEEAAAAANDRLHLKKVSEEHHHLGTRIYSPLIYSVSDGQTANFSLLPAENVYEFAAKLLFLAVKWPRSISSFLQLSYRDQAILLEGSWCELFVLTAAQWNFPVEESQLIPANLPPERRQILCDEARRLRELLTRCAFLGIDHSEYACLKAIVLFKGESRGLCDAARVTALQEQTVSVLSDRGAGRIGHLLLLLPPARALCRRTLQELLFRPTVGDISVERLLDDIVNASRLN